ncbi:Oidioi.mRNA.OKI2018_I69.chr1.g3772.t1.cds [Oikopleura dioica]|uniref:Oidioi.mRNA.OKI2018_I69.chr1.g3772.t1.cds n=1 Tax=Oikopleura dioica TaxID=34765 RepID=A0ABN7SV72_OIKDI|nr:Oidioi.mRNA.OKI2018_I69.chr1.g3772.t1.cds [Oikopleura dioica]
MGQNDQDDCITNPFHWKDENDGYAYGYDELPRDFIDSLSAEQKAKLQELKEKNKEFAATLTKDQQDLMRR